MTNNVITPNIPSWARFNETLPNNISSIADLDKWLIAWLLPKGLTVMAAHPKSCKTWIALAMGLAVSDGIRLGGVLPAVKGPDVGHGSGPVLYYGREDPPAIIKERIHILTRPDPHPIENFYIAQAAARLNLDTIEGQEALWQVVEESKPRLLIFDTARRFFGGDENSSELVGVVTNYLRNLCAELGTSCIVNHHLDAGGKKPRGSTEWPAAADCNLVVKREDVTGMRVAARIEGEARSVAPPIPWTFCLTDPPGMRQEVLFSAEDLSRLQDERRRLGDEVEQIPNGSFAVKLGGTERKVLELLEAAEGGASTRNTLREALNISGGRLKTALGVLAGIGRVEVTEEGVRLI